jgi:hypothetical protein
MKKCLKKSAPDKKMSKKSSFPTPAITHTFNDLWQSTCSGTVEKYNRIEIQHNALRPASPEFLKNFDDIFRKGKK